MAEIEYAHLVLVEDDLDLAELTSTYLTREGYRITQYHDGDAALKAIPEVNPDCVILDIMLPGIDGVELCRQLRNQYAGPVIFLTAKNDAFDEILGLEVGGDAFLTKPVEPRRLLAHVRAQLRRAQPPNQNQDITTSEPAFTVNDQRESISYRGTELDLSQPEFRLLRLLLSSDDTVITRDDIMLAIRGIEHDGVSRTVDILISDLRKKLADAEWIKTVRGRGYLWQGPVNP